jgi:malate permease and related proteins
MQTDIILSQIFILGVLVVVGIAGSAFGVLNETVKESLAKIIFNITLPLMLLTNFSLIDITPRLLINSFTMVWLSFAVMMFMLFTGWLGSRILKLSQAESSIFKTHSMFGNIIYLGFPVIYALFGEEGLLYASMLQLVSNLLMWTVGVVILNTGNGMSLRQSIKQVLNPNTLAITIGLVLFLTGWKLPDLLMKPLGGLGNSNTYLSMIYMGVMMYHSPIKGMIGKRVVYLLTLNKLLLIPFLLMALFALMGNIAGFKPDKLVMSVLILQSSMPCMANIIILAKVYGADDRLATANVFVSTIVSILTLPFILYVMTHIL